MRSSQALVSTHKAQLSDQVSLSGFGKLQPDGGERKQRQLWCLKQARPLQRVAVERSEAGGSRGVSIACPELVTMTV